MFCVYFNSPNTQLILFASAVDNFILFNKTGGSNLSMTELPTLMRHRQPGKIRI